MDLTDDSLSGTPYRVAKMYVKELFYGLDPKNKPKISYLTISMVMERCSSKRTFLLTRFATPFLPINGYAHVAYIPKDKVIGLSKINRVVDYAHRPQVQESLQILNELKTPTNRRCNGNDFCKTPLCFPKRIKDKESSTTTLKFRTF